MVLFPAVFWWSSGGQLVVNWQGQTDPRYPVKHPVKYPVRTPNESPANHPKKRRDFLARSYYRDFKVLVVSNWIGWFPLKFFFISF